MSEPILKLFTGDPYRCEGALAAREAALRAQDPNLERHVHFADEVQVGSLELDLTSLSLFALGRHFVVRRVEKVRAPKTFVPLLEVPFAQGTYQETIERTVFPSAERTVYPFYDRLGEGDLNATLTELRELREDPGRMLGGILRHLTRLVMVRLLIDQRTARSEMAASVGVQDWLLRRLIGQAQRRSLAELTAALRVGVNLDREIKSGRVRPADALMSLVFAAAGSSSTRRPR